jgi:hypothetical protein
MLVAGGEVLRSGYGAERVIEELVDRGALWGGGQRQTPYQGSRGQGGDSRQQGPGPQGAAERGLLPAAWIAAH